VQNEIEQKLNIPRCTGTNDGKRVEIRNHQVTCSHSFEL